MMDIQVITVQNPLWLETLQKLRHDIYHLPEYLCLESIRNQATPEAILISDNEKLFFVPYLLSRCDDLFEGSLEIPEAFDIVSPYGYPGILLSDSAASTPEFLELAMNQLMSVLRSKQVCSAFFRLHPILGYNFNKYLSPDICKISGETVSIDLRLSEAEIWSQTRPAHRTKINKCKRRGMKAKMLSFKEHIHEFIEIYEETMDRVGAAKSYYFNYDYFLSLAKLGHSVSLCTVELEEQSLCAGLFTESCGIVQYHLGGTRTKFLKQSPTVLMFDFVRSWAKERGNIVFHLGGGIGGSKDSLNHFKAGFSKQRHTFLTLRLITDKEKYLHLVNLRSKSFNINSEELLKLNFFPTYRFKNG